MKHPNHRAIVKFSFKKRIHKNNSFRKLRLICYSWACSEIFVSFSGNSINTTVKFKFIVNIYWQYVYTYFLYKQPAIGFIIFLNFPMFYQIFISPLVKRWVIITYKHGLYKLPHKLTNDLRPRILGI